MTLAEQYTLRIEDNPEREDLQFLSNNLSDFNASQAEKEDDALLTVFLRDSNQIIVGGLRGYTLWSWLHISQVWLQSDLRGQGYGKKIIAAAEREAVRRGCRNAHLDTFDFQAREFYEKLGYEVFGVLKNFPDGHSRFYMQKRISS